ncbi:MAG: hypothetical protein ABI990_11090 [Actinomycetota bacterium]
MRSYDFHGVDDLVETEHEQLSRITGVPLDVVAKIAGETLPPEPIPGVLRTDAELEDAYRRVKLGEQAEQELAYRAMVRDIDPSLYPDDDDLDAA